jgi:hypothetical protein
LTTIARFAQSIHRDTELETAIIQWRLFLHWTSENHAGITATSELAELYRIRYKSCGSEADLENSITMHRHVCDYQASHGLSDPISLSHLGVVIAMRAIRSMLDTDIEEAIALHGRALQLCHRGTIHRAICIHGLLQTRWLQDKIWDNEALLRNDFSLLSEALDVIPCDTPLYVALVMDLSYLTVYSTLPRNQLITDTMSRAESAIGTIPPSHRDRPYYLMNVAKWYSIFTDIQQVQFDSLERARLLYREALSGMSMTHPSRPLALSSLGYTLSSAYQSRKGNKADLDESIEIGREAVALMAPFKRLFPPCLNDLAKTLERRFQGFPEHNSDIDESINLLYQAMELPSLSIRCSGVLINNLASALFTRFKHRGGVEDLNRARDLQYQALRLYPPGHSNHVYCVVMLADFALKNPAPSLSELGSAIELLTSAVDDVRYTNRYAWRPNVLNRIARLHHARFKQTGDHQEWKLSTDTFQACVEDSRLQPSGRLIAAKAWIEAAQELDAQDTAIVAYRQAMTIMPQELRFGFDMTMQLDSIKRDIATLSCNAAGCALSLANASEAVEMLERGRAIFWVQRLQLRISSDSLRSQLSEKLKASAGRIEDLERQKPFTEVDGEEIRRHQRIAHEEFQALLHEARGDAGFPEFLLPMEFEQLKKAAGCGPVVLLSSSEPYGSYAVIIRSPHSGAEHLPLTRMTAKDLKEFVIALDDSVCYRQGEMGVENRHSDRLMIKKVKRVPVLQTNNSDKMLSILWQSIAEPIVRCLGLKVILS